MNSIKLKNIPAEIHQKLKEMAKIQHRCLNNEIIVCLEKYTKATKVEPESILNKARALRSKTQQNITQVEIQDAKNNGRK
jgi:hypothetical protein